MKNKAFMRRVAALVLVLSTVGLIWTCTVSAASGFSPRWPLTNSFHVNALDRYSGGSEHNGIDIAAVRGSSVYAVADGVVAQTCNECSHDSVIGDSCGWTWGNFVLIRHTVNGTTYYSRYAHLTQNSLNVSVGQSVSAGQLIAKSGSSGSSSGPHLHLELYEGDRTSDKARHSFQYYQDNMDVVPKLTFSSHMTSSSVFFGSWVASNYTLENGVYVYKAKCTTHTKGEYLWYEAAHPHYNYYRCSVCGTSFTDGSTTKVSSCEICNPKEYSIYYYVPADSEGNRWTKYKTETGLRGSTHEVPGDWPHMDQRYFSGWSYDINPTGCDLRPGDTFEVCPTTTDGDGYCVILYARYINHEDVVSGKPVLIYDPSEFTDSAYKLEPVNQTVTRREQHESLSDWSEWSSDSISPSNTVDVETSVVYRYYCFLCSKCGDHNPFSGNCGCGGTSNEWHQTWSPIPYSESNSSVVSYATYKRQTTSVGDGQLWYFSAGNLNDTSVGTIDSNGAAEVICNGYRSRTRTLTTSQKSETVTAYKATANHIHSMNHITAQNATCTKAGNVEYWFCTGCGKYYLDANGNTETTAAKITRPALGHNYSNGSCTRCGAADPSVPSPDAPKFVVSQTTGHAGGTVDVTISMENNPGIIAAKLQVSYDQSKLKLTNAKNGTVMGGSLFSRTYDDIPYSMLWDESLRTSDNTKNGVMVTLTFRISEDCLVGTLPITLTYNPENVFNVNMDNVTFAVDNGSIKVTTCEHVFTNKASSRKATDATCTKAATYYVQCNKCDVVSDTVTVAIGSPLGHNYVNGTCTRCSAKDPNAAEPDPNAAVVSVAPVRGKAGETVEIAVTLANNPGFSDLSIEIGYDASVMELTKVTPNSAVGCIFTTSQQLTQLPYRLNWVNGTEDSTFTGTLVTLTFQIKDSAELGSYPVTVSYYKGKYGNNIDGEDVNYNQNGSRVPIIYVNGSVTVYSYTPGDLNGDGRINSKDAIYLLRYIAGWELDGLVEDALDVNGDGKINSKDAVHLLRYIAGWDVTLH